MGVVDDYGYRLNVGIILVNHDNQLFWGRRLGSDAWQFPQGGVNQGELLKQTMFRELREEIGLEPYDVDIVAVTKRWYRYKLPAQYVRQHTAVKVIGQKQKWFLLRLQTSDQKIRLDVSLSPEFDSWRWVDYWYPPEHVIYFKKYVYQQALAEFEPLLFKK